MLTLTYMGVKSYPAPPENPLSLKFARVRARVFLSTFRRKPSYPNPPPGAETLLHYPLPLRPERIAKLSIV